MKKIAVIGGGPAGMMAAIAAARSGAAVTLYEKNEKLGKKLFITGKGRCNVTNACDTADMFENIVRNRKFLYSALYSFTNEDACRFFEENGLPLKVERGSRVFPRSDHASDVTRTLEKVMRELGVDIRLNFEINKLSDISADAVIVATGGMSYPSTGSTGDGYRFAKEAGHTITELRPSLVPLLIKEDIAASLEGLSLKNVTASFLDEKGKKLYSGFGEMLFTAKGVSGPLILTASSLLAERLSLPVPGVTLSIDLKPALDFEALDKRVQRDLTENRNRDFKNSLSKLLPAKLIPQIVILSGIDPARKANEVTKKERAGLVRLLKNLTMTVTGTEGFGQAVVTAGGVDVKEIDPKTMESRLSPGLYFAGEVLDTDALTGGFNIQLALSAGYLAGKSAAREPVRKTSS